MSCKQLVWHKSSFSYQEAMCVEVGQWRKSNFSNPSGSCVEVGAWSKASFSGTDTTGQCVEVGAWNKASASLHNGGCVETAAENNVVLVRDTKLSRKIGDKAPVQSYSLKQWRQLIEAVKAGEFMVDGGNRELKFGRSTKLVLIQSGEMTEWHLRGQGVVHRYTPAEMDAFIQGVLAGEFDLAPDLALQLSAG